MRTDWRSGNTGLYRASFILLVLSVIYQGFLAFERFLKPELQRTLRVWSLPAIERAALFLEGEDFLGYIRFLREHIPEDARVILPPHQPPSTFSNLYFAQYFLFPRDLHNCGSDEVEACIERVTGPNTYILALEHFPPRALAAMHKRYVPFNAEIGLFVPPSELDE